MCFYIIMARKFPLTWGASFRFLVREPTSLCLRWTRCSLWGRHSLWPQCCRPVEQLGRSCKCHHSIQQHRGRTRKCSTWSIWGSLPWPCRYLLACSRWTRGRRMTSSRNHRRDKPARMPSKHAKYRCTEQHRRPCRSSRCTGTLSGGWWARSLAAKYHK